MTVTEQIDLRQARCRPYMLRLRALTAGNGGAVPAQAPAEIRQATSVILTEVTAVGRVWPGTAAAAPGDQDAVPFLGVRLARLAEAAEDAVAAALEGNTAAVRRHVRRFETLISVVWTVQHMLHGSGPVTIEPL